MVNFSNSYPVFSIWRNRLKKEVPAALIWAVIGDEVHSAFAVRLQSGRRPRGLPAVLV